MKEHDARQTDWTNHMSALPATRLKTSLLRRAKMLTLCAMIFSLLSGCGVVKVAVVATVGIVGLAGYAVYKTGETVVVGVGKAGSAVATGVGAAVSVVFINGDFKTQYQGNVETVWKASRVAFEKAWFGEIAGSFDALSGTLTARTREGTEIKLKLKNIDPQSTEACIRVGITGDMKISESIHNMILRELSSPPVPTGITTSVQKVQP